MHILRTMKTIISSIEHSYFSNSPTPAKSQPITKRRRNKQQNRATIRRETKMQNQRRKVTTTIELIKTEVVEIVLIRKELNEH